MKNIFSTIIILVGLVLSGCTHTPSDNDFPRTPSGFTGYDVVRQCGIIEYTEDNRNALNDEDLQYVLKADCNQDGSISKSESKKVIFIPLDQIKRQQKSWLTRWKNEAIDQANNRRANPYICVQVLAKQDPCLTGSSTFGYAPKFSANIQSFQSKKR